MAITRAQALLVLVGNPAVLARDPLWRAFLTFVHAHGGWEGPPPAWDTAVDDIDGVDALARRLDVMRVDGGANVEGGLDEEDVEDADVNVDRPWRDEE